MHTQDTNGVTSSSPLLGIHHVTAIAGHPSDNVAFYTGVLGLRLVKQTVNFDDPETYHLYYGDEAGRPGSIITFFPWPGAQHGRQGLGQVTVTAFAAPLASLGHWDERLKRYGVATERTEVLGEDVLAFDDPEGLRLEIVGLPDAADRPGWSGGPVPAEHALRGFAHVTLAEQGYEATARLLSDVMGFRLLGASGNRFRYALGEGKSGARVDLLCMPDASAGRIAVGSVHHVAWRVSGDAEQREWRERLASQGLNVTPVLDRNYFRSIYYREPGGVLFEIATDPPGFTVDEPLDRLGTDLKLPPRLEPSRARIEAILP
ncbi:MAG TPA: ring-cleaving dioxygenase, partial [Gemmatimonadales bacterium]|nr:ring-cleaving dioxygenase [Gemmatimonadales bacterium]